MVVSRSSCDGGQSEGRVRNNSRRRFLAGVAAACLLTHGRNWRAAADQNRPVVRVTLDNVGTEAWQVIGADGPISVAEAENPRLRLVVGTRYVFENEGWDTHPLAFLDVDGNPLLSQRRDGRFADDSDADPVADGETLSFTVTRDLAAALDHYECTEHPPMRGDVRTPGTDAPEAGVWFPNQSSSGNSVVVSSVRLGGGGFVAVYDRAAGISPDSLLGVSPYLDAGVHRRVAVDLDIFPLDLPQKVVAVPHRDTTETGTFDFAKTGGDSDPPYAGPTGGPVTNGARVTLRIAGSCFEIQTLEPTEATFRVGETVTVRAEIVNVGDFPGRPEVSLSIGGRTQATTAVELRSDDSQTVPFEIETADLEPGEHTFSVEVLSNEQTGTLFLEAATSEITPTGGAASDDNPTATADGGSDETDTSDTADGTADDEGTGFGIAPGVVGTLGAAGYLLLRRGRDSR